jgi:hypothetical protein
MFASAVPHNSLALERITPTDRAASHLSIDGGHYTAEHQDLDAWAPGDDLPPHDANAHAYNVSRLRFDAR